MNAATTTAPVITYSVTPKGKSVLNSAASWGLSCHLRELLGMCRPRLRLDHARQSIPPESLQIALYSLLELELIEGPPVQPPRDCIRLV